eukprot:9660288-Alexandrium_andersonii.AAC.1
MSASLVGSEMCIRDSHAPPPLPPVARAGTQPPPARPRPSAAPAAAPAGCCLLYTSDAADDM